MSYTKTSPSVIYFFVFVFAGLAADAPAQILYSGNNTPEIRAKAEAGDAESQYKLGQYAFAKDSTDEAVMWYRKAAEQGYSAAQYSLGSMLHSIGNKILPGYDYARIGEKVLAESRAEAAMWLTKASQQKGEFAEMASQYMTARKIAPSGNVSYAGGSTAVPANASGQAASNTPPAAFIESFENVNTAQSGNLEHIKQKAREGHVGAITFLDVKKIPYDEPSDDPFIQKLDAQIGRAKEIAASDREYLRTQQANLAAAKQRQADSKEIAQLENVIKQNEEGIAARRTQIARWQKEKYAYRMQTAANTANGSTANPSRHSAEIAAIDAEIQKRRQSINEGLSFLIQRQKETIEEIKQSNMPAEAKEAGIAHCQSIIAETEGQIVEIKEDVARLERLKAGLQNGTENPLTVQLDNMIAEQQAKKDSLRKEAETARKMLNNFQEHYGGGGTIVQASNKAELEYKIKEYPVQEKDIDALIRELEQMKSRPDLSAVDIDILKKKQAVKELRQISKHQQAGTEAMDPAMQAFAAQLGPSAQEHHRLTQQAMQQSMQRFDEAAGQLESEIAALEKQKEKQKEEQKTKQKEAAQKTNPPQTSGNHVPAGSVFADTDIEALKKKADAGDTDAQYQLGGEYWRGAGGTIGGVQNKQEALKYWKMAAGQGHTEAQLALGQNLFAGFYETLGGQRIQDKAEGIKYLRQAAAQGNRVAAAMLLQNNIPLQEEKQETKQH